MPNLLPLPSGKTRRTFLQATVAGTTAALLPRPVHSAASIEEDANNSHMKLSLSAYSFHAYLPDRRSKDDPAKKEMSLDKFIQFCADLDLDGTELTGYYFPKVVTDYYLMSLKQRTHRLGLSISGTAIGNDFCLPEGERRSAQLAMCREWIDYAAAMGAPLIRIFAGATPRGDSEEVAIARTAAGINECLQHAAKKGIFLALENHGGVTETPGQMFRIIEQVDESPWFGINLDSGNFHSDDPYRELQAIAPHAINAQIKVNVAPNKGPRKPTDFARVIGILRDANYRGYVTLEYELQEDPWGEIPRFVDQLRSLTQS